jgi:hypothetical protein
MVNQITISIASYRDPDLVNTIRSAIDNAKYPDQLFFSVFSQAEDSEHPDLSFVKNLNYQKAHWSESLGACWARERANRDLTGDYFLQIDSHSRFLPNWDKLLVLAYKKAQSFWGNRIFFTNYPDPFELDVNGDAVTLAQPTFFKLEAYWHEEARMVQGKWADVEDTINGDEQFFMSANSMFSEVRLMQEVPYDPELYFTGEEPSLALRAYTRGIRLISPTVKFMFTNFNRPNSNRRLHWEDNPSWHELNDKSYSRLKKIMSGDKTLGKFGIGSTYLFNQYQKITGINLVEATKVIE